MQRRATLPGNNRYGFTSQKGHQKVTYSSAHGMCIGCRPTLMMGSWFYVECGSSASGRRRSLRFEGCTLTSRRFETCGRLIDALLLDGGGPTHGSAPDME